MIEAPEPERSRPLVVVCAPAGYGKSTFAAQWCRSCDRPTAWVALRDADNDPVELLSRVSRALESLELMDPEFGDALNRPSPLIETELVPRFVDTMVRRAPFQLALDDVHVINKPRAVDALRALANAVPDGSQLVLVSRTVPPVGLARIRVAERVYELGAAELAFDDDETRQLFSLATVELSPDEAAKICDAAEGWAAGLALTARSRKTGAEASPLRPPTDGWRDIADYFREQVLDLEPAHVREFLLTTSVVERLSGPLCDAMTGRDDCSRLLFDLAATNLFVIPLDEHGRWFRYHRLFRELLEAELQRESEPAVAALLDRASRWHENHGDPGEAFEYARRAEDFDRAGWVLLGHFEHYMGSGRIETVLRWIDRCSEQEIESDPKLAIASGWIASHAGQAERSRRYLAAAERADLDVPSPEGATSLRASMLILRGGLGVYGVSQMLEDGQAVVDSELPTRARYLRGGYRNVGVAQLLLGHPRAAIESLNDSLVFSEGIAPGRYAHVLCLGLLALAHIDLSDWTRAHTYVSKAEEQTTGLEHMLERLPALAARALIAANAGDAPAGTLAVAEARRLMDTATPLPYLYAEVALRCAQAADLLGDDDVARALLWEAHVVARRLGDGGTIPTRIRSLYDRLSGIDPLAASLSPAEKRVLRQLATHRTLKEIAEHLFVSRATVKTQVAAIYSKLGVTTRAEAVATLGDLAVDRPLADIELNEPDIAERPLQGASE